MSRVDRLMLEGATGNAKTARSLHNLHYCTRAMAYLQDDDRFKWLIDRETGAWKPGILAELGRIEDPEELREYAEAICDAKPKTKDAITRLRRARIGKTSPPSALDLANALINVINEYIKAHPDTTKTDVRNALLTARGAVESSLPDDSDDDDDDAI